MTCWAQRPFIEGMVSIIVAGAPERRRMPWNFGNVVGYTTNSH